MIDLNNQDLIDQDYINDIDDLLRIQKAFFNVKKWFITLDEAAFIWQNYSSNLCASWLFVPVSDEDIIMYIELDDYFEGYAEVFERMKK